MNVSIVISAYNEAEGIRFFFDQITNELEGLTNYPFEVMWINDGSTDGTEQVLQQLIQIKHKEHIKHTIINLTKNYGHEAAMLAGIDHSQSDLVICMDSDGQHPTRYIPAMLDQLSSGYDVVMMQREQNRVPMWRKACTTVFYLWYKYDC